MHTGVGRTYPLHIEYIHIGVCLSFIQDVFTEAILSHPRISLHRKIGIVKALGKVIWIQNDLFAKWYVHDGEEFEGEREEIVVEKEGYLHGKKVFDELNEESDSGEETDKATTTTTTPEKEKVKPAVCPFTGVSMEGLKISNPHDGPKSPTRIPVPKEQVKRAEPGIPIE